MAGDSHVDDSKLKGMSKYFNGETIKGRANVSFFFFSYATNLSKKSIPNLRNTGCQSNIRRSWSNHCIFYAETIKEMSESPLVLVECYDLLNRSIQVNKNYLWL